MSALVCGATLLPLLGRETAMSDPEILDRIDATLDDYEQWNGHSPDAARWDGDDWVDERATGWIDELHEFQQRINAAQERVHAAALGGFPQRVIVGIDPASPPHAPYLQAVDEAATSIEALAAEEHRQGMAYGDEADHCGDCKREAFLRLQAECEHDGDQADITTLGDVNRQLLCQRCGAIREVPR